VAEVRMVDDLACTIAMPIKDATRPRSRPWVSGNPPATVLSALHAGAAKEVRDAVRDHLTFDSVEKAEAYAVDLAWRWTSVRNWQVVDAAGIMVRRYQEEK
jgi:hypothetical protein